MERIAELYGELYDELEQCFKESKKSEDKELSILVPMKGFRYDSESIKLMVVGRATNGWKKEINIEQRDAFICDAIEKLNNPCRFSWILEEKQKTEKKDRYYAEAKPFWNYTRCVLEKLYGSVLLPDWYQSIVWSNLFPVSFAKEGNPSAKLKDAQLHVAKKLLREQINYFQPTHVLIISNWDDWFFINKKEKECTEKECQFLQEVERKRKDENDEVIKGSGILGSSSIVVSRRPEFFKKDVFVKDVISEFELLEKKKHETKQS